MADLRLYKLQPEGHRLWVTEDQEEPIILPSTVPVPFMIQTLELQERFDQAKDGDDPDTFKRAMQDMYEGVMEVVRPHNPGLGDLPLSMDDLVLIVNVIVSGQAPQSIEEARQLDQVVAEQIAPPPGDPTPAANRAARRASTRSQKPSRARS